MKNLFTKELKLKELPLIAKIAISLIILAILYLVSPLLAIIYLIYFSPSIVAAKRCHKFKYQILILNTFLGATIIGWVGALIWATLPQKNEDKDESRQIIYWLIGLLVIMYITFIFLMFLSIV